MDEINLIASFLHVADEGTLSKAAATMGVSQSVLSRRIQDLEHSLSKNLLVRHSRGIALTSEGHALVEAFRPLVVQLKLALENQKVRGKELAGNLRIGSVREFGQHALAPLLARFLTQQPGVRAELQLESSQDICKQLLSGGLHAGVIPFESAVSGLKVHKWIKEEFVVVAPAQDALPLFANEAPRFVVYKPHQPLWGPILRGKRNLEKQMEKPFLIVNSHQAALAVLREVSAYALVPRALIKGSTPYAVACSRTSMQQLAFCSAEGKYKNPLVAELWEWLRANIKYD